MTVISSVYKDDDVKCHTSRAEPPGERPGSFRSTLRGLSLFPDTVLFVLFFFYALASSLSDSFYYPPLHSTDFSLYISKLHIHVLIFCGFKKTKATKCVS